MILIRRQRNWKCHRNTDEYPTSQSIAINPINHFLSTLHNAGPRPASHISLDNYPTRDRSVIRNENCPIGVGFEGRNRESPRSNESHAETMIKIVNIHGRPPVLRPLRGHGAPPAHPIYQRILDYGKRRALTNVDSRAPHLPPLDRVQVSFFKHRTHLRARSSISPRELPRAPRLFIGS